VFALSEKILTSDVNVKNGRLFEVEIGFDCDRAITAARFTLTYNKNDIEARETVCSLSNAKVKFNDTNGKTDIIFLCSSGVKCSEFPKLFTMKYKKISDNNSKITIKATDCVDADLKSFPAPKSAVCVISAVSASGTSGKASKDNDDKSDSDSYDDEKDILETSSNYDELSEEGNNSRIFANNENSVFYSIILFVILVIILVFLGLILYQNIRLKKQEKQRESENKDIED